MTRKELLVLLQEQCPKLYWYLDVITDLNFETGEDLKGELTDFFNLALKQGREEALKKVEVHNELSNI